MQEDLTFGKDVRGDTAFFIERRHLQHEGFGKFDREVGNVLFAKGVTAYVDRVFFRILQDGGETRMHGWLEFDWVTQTAKVVQWG